MIKAILFDFDDTLSDRQMANYRLLTDCLRKYFPDLNDYEYEGVVQDFLLGDCFGLFSMAERVYLFKKKHNVPDTFEEEFTKEYYDSIAKYNVLKNETIETLEALKGKYKLGILTNGFSDTQHGKIEQVKIADYFDSIVVSGDLPFKKPDKRIYEYAANELGVTNEECLFVGDLYPTDILGAIRAGMPTVWVTSDVYRPTENYHGYRITLLNELIELVKKM